MIADIKAPYTATGSTRDTSDSPDVGVFSYMHVLIHRKWTVLVAILITVSIALFINIKQAPLFLGASEVLLEVRQGDSESEAIGAVPFDLNKDPTFLLTQVRFISSPELARVILSKIDPVKNRAALVKCFGLEQSFFDGADNKELSEEEQRVFTRSIQRAISAGQLNRLVRIIEITVEGFQPDMVALIANAAAKSYVEMNYSRQMQTFQDNFSRFSKSLSDVRESIKVGEIALKKVTAEIELLENLRIYAEKHPSVVRLTAQIPEYTASLQEGLSNIARLDINVVSNTKTLLSEPHLTLETLEPIAIDLVNVKVLLEQELATRRQMYNSVFKKLQEVEVAGGGTWVDSKVVREASVPHRPIRPNKSMNIFISLVTGLMIGFGLAFLQEYLDSSIRTLDDVRSILNLNPIGMIPYVDLYMTEEEQLQVDPAKEYINEEEKGKVLTLYAPREARSRAPLHRGPPTPRSLAGPRRRTGA